MALMDATECSACGCADVRVVGNTRRCRHCGKPWIKRLVPVRTAEESPPKPEIRDDISYYVKAKCTKCGSKNTRAASTRKMIQYRKCQDCGHSFKSMER